MRFLALLLALSAQEAEAPVELRALETFDAAWSIIDSEHFDPSFHGVDWQAVRTELRPRAASAVDRAGVRGTISAMLARLGQSHFQLIPEEALGASAPGTPGSQAATPGLDLRWLEGQAVVIEVEPDGPAERAGVRPGWLLVSLDGTGIESALATVRSRPGFPAAIGIWKALRARLDGEAGSRVVLGFEDEQGEPRALELERVARAATPFDPPGLPRFFPTWDARRVERAGRSFGILRFSNWLEPLLAPLEKALSEWRDCPGIVLDLRGNTGGDSQVVTSFAGHFFEQPTSLGEIHMRNGSRAFDVQPRTASSGRPLAPFRGRLAILVDGTTGSSSEVFAGGLQALGRARIFGSRTAGVALPASLARLPNGDWLMHAVGEFATARGAVLEGDGVHPDHEAERTRADALAERDPALEAALAWLVEEGDAR